MFKYHFYIDATTGLAYQATAAQLEKEPTQILCITGIEALMPPQVWIGPYNGEMLFYPCYFENIQGRNDLQIAVGNTVIRSIRNISYQRYEFTYTIKDKPIREEVTSYINKLQALAELG